MSNKFIHVHRSSNEKSKKHPLVVLLHGYGSNENDLFSFQSFFPENHTIVSFRAPLTVFEGMYAWYEIYFENNPPPSILEVNGAKKVAVEFTTLSKTYAMAGWRIGFAVGNERIISALIRVKSYLDYGAYTPIQVAASAALNGPQDCVDEIRKIYKSRRDVLVKSFLNAGWEIPEPASSMFAWAPIPDQFKELGSVEFSKLLLKRTMVAEIGRAHV